MASIETRKNTHGNVSYYVKIRLKGHRQTNAAFDRLTDAKQWAQKTEADMRRGRHFDTVESRRRTVADLLDRYRNEVLPKKEGCSRSQPGQLDWWKSEAGHLLLADLTPARIAEFRDKLLHSPRNPRRANHRVKQPLSRHAPATVNRYLAVLSHACTIAMKEWAWLDDNPLRKVRKLREAKGRDRFLSDDERKSLLQACTESKSPHLHLIVVLAISTGMRRGEILSLCWGQIDLDRKRITLHKTKNGDTRSIPLVGLAFDLMTARRPAEVKPTDRVFAAKSDDSNVEIKKGWAVALKAANLSEFRFHDLRHTAASYLAMNGATLLEIAAILGHRTLAMVKRYAHLTDTHTHRVVAAMNEKVFGGAQ
jgi:integrase